MRKHALRVACLTLLVLLARQAGAAAASLTERFEHTYPLRAGGELSLDNVNGSVAIAVWDRQEVQVVAEKKVRTGKAEDAKRLLAQLKIDVAPGPGKLRIDTRYPKHEGGGFWGWLTGNDASLGVEYRLTVPRSVKLDLETVNGKVQVAGTRGDLHAETTNGGIAVSDVEGRLVLETTNGGIDVSGASGAVDADTTNGGIAVELTEVSGGDMKFSTTNGGITVRLPRTIQATVEASTVNGGIESGLTVAARGKASRHHLEGDVNGGGGRLELATVNGGIHLLESGGR